MSNTAQYEQQILDVVEKADASQPSPTVSKDIVILSSGVVLKRKQVPILRIQTIIAAFTYPPVPEIYDKERDRVLKNPDHPIYQEERAAVDEKRALAAVDAITAFGTELLEVPEGVSRPEDDDWVEECRLFNLPINTKSVTARYLAWIKYVAIITDSDLQAILSLYTDSMGTAEKAVAKSVEAFPG